MLRDTKYKFDQFVLKVYGFGDHKRIKLVLSFSLDLVAGLVLVAV